MMLVRISLTVVLSLPRVSHMMVSLLFRAQGILRGFGGAISAQCVLGGHPGELSGAARNPEASQEVCILDGVFFVFGCFFRVAPLCLSSSTTVFWGGLYSFK